MLLLGFNRLDREPDECAVDALLGVKDQVLDWSAYWYWEHQYFPKNLKRLKVCTYGRFWPLDSTLSFSLCLLAAFTSEFSLRP